jgi:hypothetical protein
LNPRLLPRKEQLENPCQILGNHDVVFSRSNQLKEFRLFQQLAAALSCDSFDLELLTRLNSIQVLKNIFFLILQTFFILVVR